MDRNDFDLLLNDFVQISYDLQCLEYCQMILERDRAESEMPLHLSSVVLRDCIERMESATDRLDMGIIGLCKKGSL